MAILAKCFRSAIFAAIAACGSQGPSGGHAGGAENGGDDPGFVGSGGYGRVDDGNPPTNGSDGGGLFDDGGSGIRDGGTAGPSSSSFDGDSSSGGPLLDSSDSATELDSGSTSDGSSSVGVAVNSPEGFFVFLDWSISGPAGSYSGRVYFGDARSIEFVAGGIQAGSGYTITLTGTDRDGQICSGTSAPFTVVPGAVSGAGLLISCPASGGPANVTTGGVSVEAGVSTADM